MELLVAIGVFVVGIATIGLLIMDAYVSSRQGVERTQAVLLAKEGLEAARSIRDGDFDNLAAGTHGIALSGGYWIFSGTSDTQDQFARQITVTNLNVDTKQVQSQVTWQITAVRQGSVVLTDYLTDWNQTHGQAGELGVDTKEAELGEGDTELTGITIENTGVSDITIDKITVWWDGDRLIEEIVIDGNAVWSETGPGSPSGKQPSGTELDIQDFVVTAGGGQYSIDRFKFDGPMTGVGFIILFKMADNSTNYVMVETAGCCSGTVIPCHSYTRRRPCEDQEGCLWNPDVCEGTCTPCSGLGRTQCRQQDGCRWGWWRCTGTCRSCDRYNNQNACGDQLGCYWTPAHCSGVARPCGNYTDQGSCDAQDGCHWVEP